MKGIKVIDVVPDVECVAVDVTGVRFRREKDQPFELGTFTFFVEYHRRRKVYEIHCAAGENCSHIGSAFFPERFDMQQYARIERRCKRLAKKATATIRGLSFATMCH